MGQRKAGGFASSCGRVLLLVAGCASSAQDDGLDCRDGRCQSDGGTRPVAVCYVDADGDGYAAATAGGQLRADCREPGFTQRAPYPGVDDCDDSRGDVHPGIALDGCDGVDTDCDAVTDEDATPTCEDATVLLTCQHGAWVDTSCSVRGQTCVAGACAGECVSGDVRCAPDSNGYEVCDSAGAYQQPVGCDESDYATWEICRDARCVVSEVREFGNADALDYTERLDLFPHEWAITSIDIAHDTQVHALHAVLEGPPVAATARFAVWASAEDGDYAGPGERVTWSSIVGAESGDTRAELAFSRQAVLLGGHRYWIGINVSNEMQLHTRTVEYPTGDDYNFWSSPRVTDLTATVPDVEPLAGWTRGVIRFGLFIEGKALR